MTHPLWQLEIKQTSVGEDMEKSEPSHIAGKYEQYSCCGKQYLKKLSTELPDDQQFQSKVYTWEKWKHVYTNTCTWIFTAVLQ